MSIQDIFKHSWCYMLLLPSLLLGQEEDLKFGQPILDTALVVESLSRLNTTGIEFAPAYYRQGLVYLSAASVTADELKKGKEFFSLRYAPFDEEGYPIAPVPFAIDENTANHKGPVSFGEKDQVMFLSRTREETERKRKKNSPRSMNIYRLVRGDTFWVDQELMPFNQQGYTSFHPSLSSDGTFIVFSSDRPGGFGGFDLWGADFVNGKWSEPFNLGESINSEANEAFPFIYKNRYLFYSSNREGGEGNYDFYFSKEKDNTWQKTASLGSQFNTGADEVGIIFSDDGTTGFFASNRRGIGEDDLYRFKSSVHLFEKRVKALPIEATILVTDEATNMRLSDVKLWVFPVDEEGIITSREAYKTVITERAEEQGLTLERVRKQPMELDSPITISNRNGEARISNVQPGETYTVLLYRKGYLSREIPLTISADAADTTIRTFLTEKECLHVEIEALSNDPAAKQSFQLELLSIGSEDQKTYSLSQKDEICISYGKPYLLVGYKEGFIPDSFRLAPQEESVEKISVLFRLLPKESGVPISKVDPSKPLSKGNLIVLDRIYYDFNKSSIRVGAEKELDALTDIMEQYKDIKIELSSHTDARGSKLYNLRLSLRRAESAKSYLVAKGIAPERIQAIGYGENRVRNHCSDGVSCNEKEHQYNRRTEVKVISDGSDVKISHQRSE